VEKSHQRLYAYQNTHRYTNELWQALGSVKIITLVEIDKPFYFCLKTNHIIKRKQAIFEKSNRTAGGRSDFDILAKPFKFKPFN